ncbi:MAG: hypothetical protein HY905_20145 [Deltaproteobacteria bacterium]|nr:hypothetical protein [Deltaproteobacteria bacterium]
MRSVAPWVVAVVMFGAACPSTRHPAVPVPEGGDGGSGASAGEASGGMPGLLADPGDSEQAARDLLAVEADPGQAVVVLHCGFADGWASAVPLELADEIGDYLVQAVVALGSFQEIATQLPNRGRLAAYAAQACAPELVLRLAPGAWQLVVGRRTRLVPPLAEDAGWMDTVELSAGDRLDYYVGEEDVTLDLPCR